MITEAINRLLPNVVWELSGDTLDGLNIITPNVTPPTQAEVDAEILIIKEENDTELTRSEAMLKGALYDGVMVSLTVDDGNGVLQAGRAFELGATSTNLHLVNGNKLPLTSANFTAFEQWFAIERGKFFL